MNRINDALSRVDAARDGYLQELSEFLAIPSISTLPENREDVLETAQWLSAHLARLGCAHVEVIATGGHPVVYGEWLGAPGRPTVLVYGHYDVQPVDPINEWESDPFVPTVRGDYVYARGASDMKAQIFAQLKAMEALAGNGGFPVNVKYLLEGEEEIGSPHLPAFIDQYREKLACDVVLNCDGGIIGPDTPAITYALRGLAYFELSLVAHAKDLHSGVFGGSVHNPIHVLADLIAGMHDAGGRVTLPGFYDKVRDLDPEERAELARLPHDDAQWMAMAGSKSLHGEAGYTTIERVGARPTLDVNGIWGGFTGEGSKTVLPARAHAKISTRLVADQVPGDVRGQLEAYLTAQVPEGIQWSLKEHTWGPGSIMDRKSDYMKAAVDALRTTFGTEPIFKREGGSVPVVGIMQEALGVDSVMLGFELPDDGFHGPNERFYLPNLYRGVETYVRFLSAL